MTDFFKSRISKSLWLGSAGSLGLFTLYFGIVTLISGWNFTLGQFASFWYFIVSLAVGFGVQVGLYSYLRSAVLGQTASGKVVAVSGTTSTVAMISCCAHYLANILPVIGVAGAISLIGQYQIELFWVGLAANAFGIWYIATKIRKFLKA